LPLSRIDESADMAENANTIGVPAWFSGMASVAIYVRGRCLLPDLGYLFILGQHLRVMLLARHHSLMKGGSLTTACCVSRTIRELSMAELTCEWTDDGLSQSYRFKAPSGLSADIGQESKDDRSVPLDRSIAHAVNKSLSYALTFTSSYKNLGRSEALHGS
jgi:hypothetical protein